MTDEHPSQYLTVPGRILVFSTLLAGFGGVWACHGPLRDYFAGGAPWGGLYLFPGIFCGIIFFTAGATVLRVLGIRIVKQPVD